MKLKLKAIFAVCLLIAVLGLFAGCSPEKTPYEINDGDGYNVSVKFDANGGIFTTNTPVIVDSYNISEMQLTNGYAQIPLIAPDNALRGNDAFTAINNGYFLAGWYAKKTETLDENGNPCVVYGDRWDFDQDVLSVDASKDHTASEPVLTLYAAWVPLFEIHFYDLATGEFLETLSFDPGAADEISVPKWDEETGTIEMFDFPQRSGYTFAGVYYDAAGTQSVETAAVNHPGTVDYTNGMAKNHSLSLYVDYTEGEWYRIYNVEQFLKNASVSGSYEIYADLDFAGQIWPTSMMYGNFTGSIRGNGHTFKNITLEQTNNSKVNAGLFGYLTETAAISDLTLENVTFTIKAGTRVTGASFGVFAGTVSEQALITNVQILSSTLQIDTSCYFGTEDYVIGLVSGMGDPGIDYSDIACTVVGDNPENVTLTVSGSTVTLQFHS